MGLKSHRKGDASETVTLLDTFRRRAADAPRPGSRRHGGKEGPRELSYRDNGARLEAPKHSSPCHRIVGVLAVELKRDEDCL